MKFELTNVFIPKEEIAGLAFTDQTIHLILFSAESKLVSKSGVILPAGVIENGQVKDRLKLSKALEILKAQAGPRKLKSNPYVIVSIPSQDIYSQIIDLPQLSPEQTEEAVKWNAQMTLPLQPDQMYYDWEELKAAGESAFKKEVFVALASKSKVDPYLGVLEEAGFVPLAFEMPALGIVRLVHYFVTGIDPEAGQLIVYIDWAGVEFLVMKNGILRFNYYRAWLPQEKDNFLRGGIVASELVGLIDLDIQKVLNFYQARSQKNVSGVVLISVVGKKGEIAAALKEKIGMDIADFRLKYYADLDDAWFASLGSALRGLIPRSDDTIVSLMPLGTEEAYRKQKLLSFVSFWGNITGIVTLTLGVLFMSFYFFFNGIESQYARQVVAQPINRNEMKALEDQARDFNNLVAGIINANTAARLSYYWPVVFSEVFRVADEGDITILRIPTAAIQGDVSITASAASRENALDFKKRLESEIPFIYDVRLPPAGFTSGIRVTFNVAFSIDASKLIEFKPRSPQ